MELIRCAVSGQRIMDSREMSGSTLELPQARYVRCVSQALYTRQCSLMILITRRVCLISLVIVQPS